MVLFRSVARFLAFIVFAAFALPALHLAAQPTNPIPLVDSPLVPSSVSPGSPELALTVRGTGFVAASVVNWNGIALGTAFVSSRQLVADVPASALASAGTATLTVSSPAPGGGVSNAIPFTIVAPTSFLAFTTFRIPVGVNPGGIVAADFNHDGKTDLAIVNQNQPAPTCYTPGFGNVGTISILLGNGDGTFLSMADLCFPEIGHGQFSGAQLLTGDFNGDGKTDLVATAFTEGLWSFAIFLGNGDGTFASPGYFDLWEQIGALSAADFNRDGNLDIAFPFNETDYRSIGIDLGNGDGTFSNGGGLSSFLDASSQAVGDFNRDGALDLAAAGASAVTILMGSGNGNFSMAPSQPSVQLTDPSSLALGDFNGDGILDLAIADAGSPALTILKGNGDGTFIPVSGEPALSEPANFVATYDFNGDGKLDLVFASASNTISIYLGNGDGTFRPGLIQAMDYAPYGVAIGDFNGDGRLDLAVTNADDGSVSILLQKPGHSGATITLASGQSPAHVDAPVTYTAVAFASPTTPTGSVTFKQGANVLGVVALANGEAKFTTSFAKAGNYTIVATYSGDPNYPAKNSTTVKQVVDKYASYSYLYSDSDATDYGQAVTLTCFVLDNGAPNAPAGSVIFHSGTSSIGRASIVNGTATLTVRNLPVGAPSITATYAGDGLHNNSASDPLTHSVNPAATTTVVTSSRNPAVEGQNIKFTATVTSRSVVPVGTVTFTAGNMALGTVELAMGQARLTTAAVPPGTTTITATYSGTPNIMGSSGSISQTVH